MRRFRAMIKKEITQMLRDPRTLIMIFIMPILQLFLMGYANNTEVKYIPTVLFDQSNSRPAARWWMRSKLPNIIRLITWPAAMLK